MTKTGIDELLGRLDRLTGVLGSLAERWDAARRTHPTENWCSAPTKEGLRCLRDAEADGLCKLHWRMVGLQVAVGGLIVAALKLVP